MKKLYGILLILFLPAALLAQDTTILKKQANIAAQAAVTGDYKTLVEYMYPKMVDMGGGTDKMVSLTDSTMKALKTQGVNFESATIGSPGKFYKAGAEIHCIIPEFITLKIPDGHLLVQSNLLAITGDGGKTYKFLDMNKDTVALIKTMFPNFNPDLKIPEPIAPVRKP